MFSPSRCLFAAALFLASAAGVLAQAPPLASGQLEIRGNRLTLYADTTSGATDARQTLNIGERGRVRTCFGGPTVPCGSVVAGDPRIAGLKVEAELSGPELPQPLVLTTVPGGSFLLPGFQQEGDYTLENIRLVSAASGQVIALAEPSLAVLNVRQIVLSSATVRTLSLEELRARGIELTEENFQAFDFAVGFAIQGYTVEIEFPVVYQGNGLAQPLGKPTIKLDDLPASIVRLVAGWKPPMVQPIRLEPSRDLAPTSFVIGDVEHEDLTFPLFGAIVIPGTVTFLNQFFEAQLIVANGAPAGSGADLTRVRAMARLPGNQALRLAETKPPVVPGQWVPVIGADGSQSLAPAEKGSAAWVIEGLKPGTHGLILEIEGELERPGREPLPVRSLAQAAVEVVDARFQLTFSHPDVVRELEEYTLFVTVTNQSQAAQNLIKVDIREESMTGARPADPEDPLSRTIETLQPGQAATVEFRLVSQLTGKVIATTYQSDSANYLGTIQLRTGVGELGIPLSPATLLMPRFTSELEQRDAALVRHNVAQLGLAYSLAVAPSSLLPAGVAPVAKADVERRAIDLAEAGERLYLGEAYLETLEALLYDQLGNRHPLESFDQLRRQTTKGLRAAEALAAALRGQQQVRGLDAIGLFDHLTTTMSYARPHLAAILAPVDGSALPSLEAIDHLGGIGLLAGTADREAAARRTLPWGELYSVRAEAGADGPRASLAVIGRLDGEATNTFVVRNDGPATSRSRLVLVAPDGDDGAFRRLDFGVITLAPGQQLAIDAGAAVAGAGQGGFRPYDPATQVPISAAPAESIVQLPPFRVVGARQDFYLDFSVDEAGNWYQPNRYGNGVTYLFNRPPEAGLAEVPEAFEIASDFDGQTISDTPFAASSTKVGQAAFIQPNSERVVIVRYDGGICALVDGEMPLVEHRHQLDQGSIRDRFGTALAEPVPAPRIESSPLHVGALVAGQVKRGSGGPVAGVQVELMRQRWFLKPSGNHIIYTDLASTTTTDATGRFFFDYVESPIHDGKIKPEFFLRAQVPAGADPLTEPAEVGEVSFTMRRQNKAMVVNIALLGRGGITGRLSYLDNGAPVPFGTVEAASTLFSEQQKVTVDADGTFRFLGLPVGPISLAGRDSEGRRVYATVEIPAPGAVNHVDLEIQRQNTVPPQYGTVTGKVLFLRDGVPEPALGATIAIYADGNFLGSKEVGAAGGFTFTQIPAGRVSLQAANFRVSRTAIYTDLLLGVEEVREVELRIPASSPKSISGQVVQRDLSTGAVVPLAGATVLLLGPGNLTFTGADGRYLLENVPIQSSNTDGYELQVISPDRTKQRLVELPPILAASPDETVAETAVFDISSVTRGRVRGRVFDPNGQPVPFAKVVLYPFDAGGEADATGAFVFENVPFGTYFLVGRVDEGLTPGKIGWLGKTEPFVLAGNPADAFVEVHMRGSGFVKVHTRTATSTGILTPIFYKPTYYSKAAKDILLRGSYTESSTDPNGHFEVELPLGDFHLVAYNPFHGQKEISGTLTAAGELKEYEIVFETLGKVRGTVVEPDGITPVPFAEVVLSTRSLLPQTLQADEQGKFLFELVPAGPVSVAGRATVGNVERVGRTLSDVGIGQDLELTVVLLKQGSIKGKVMQESSTGLVAVPNAQYYVEESSYPHRRLPEGKGNFYFTDANGEYEVSHLFAGEIRVYARDSGDITREGSAKAKIEVDWSIVNAPNIVFRGADALGKITLLVRDPQTGAPVADALVRLSTGEGSVTGADGTVVFEALKVWMSENRPMTYTARAFYAPTGQAGESGPVVLSQAGEAAVAEIYLDQRGEVRGFLYSDPSRTEPIAGATIKISGFSTAGRVEGLTTTSGQAGQLGRFVFSGIPEGTYTLLAASTETPRRAGTTVALTDTSPIVDLFLYLEQVGDRYFRIDQKLRAGNAPVDLAAGIFSVKLVQGAPTLPDYAFTNLLPEAGSNLFLFQDIFLERSAAIEARELDGELRQFGALIPNFVYTNPLPGGGTPGDPHRLVLPAKGTVTAEVRDADDRPVAGINVRLGAAGTNYASATGADGKVTFVGVNAGTVTVSARSFDNIFSGSATGTIVYDDDALALTIRFQPAVRATGRVYSPPLFDRTVIDPSTLEPLPAARVELVDKSGVRHVTFTDSAGVYNFEGLPKGAYTVSAASPDGSQVASHAGNLLDPNGNLNQIPALVLDGGPPKIVQMSPPSGASGVSKTTTVEIIFSEPLAAGFLPTGPSSQHFFFRKSSGNVAVAGNWTHFPDSEGRQIVRFVPGGPLDDFTLYSLTIRGWVTDRVGRLLNPAGDVGSSFRTSDASGPTVLSTEPLLSRPVHPAASIRIDFNERVVASAEDLDGDGNADAAVLEARKLDGSWVALPSVYYLTRLNFSLQLDLPQGLSVPDDSLRRRLTVSRLRDESGNSMVTWQRELRLYDSNTPTLAVPLPANAPDGNLYNSLGYKLSPALGNLDDATAQLPGGDIDRVEYFFVDPAAVTSPPGFVARSHPFEYSFVASYVGTGQPRPFPVWVRAVDTSNNASPVVFVDLRVLPHAPPSVGDIAASAEGGIFYSGKYFAATVSGINDPDSASLSLLVDFVRLDTQPPQVIVQSSQTLSRPPAGWAELPAPTVSFNGFHTRLPEGTPFYFRARVADAGGLSATVQSSDFAVADDTQEPQVSFVEIRYAGGYPGGLVFTIGDQVYFRFQPSDAETGIRSARVTFDRPDIFPAPLAAHASYFGRWETSVATVPATLTERTTVVATIEVEDFGGNTRLEPFAFEVRPANDPFAPTAAWTSPFTASRWPAAYSSVIPGAGVPLLLRVKVADTSQGPNGEPIPGRLFSVEMRGPELAPDGSIGMKETWTAATLVPGTEAPGFGEYQLLWHVPNDLPAGSQLDFAVRAIDLGGAQTVETVQMVVVPARRVYQGVTAAVFPDDQMLDFTSTDPNGPIFFLDGTLLSIYPQTDGSLRSISSLYIYSGGFLSSGSLQRRDSKLVPVEINSLDSAILYYPLELGIETFLGVGGGSAIDGDGAGLLGGTLSRPIVLPGMTGPEVSEAGYHGGMVRFQETVSEKLLRVYGDPRWPLLPGLGGRTNTISSDFRDGGAPGGGAIRIEAAAATVHLGGNLSARGMRSARGRTLGTYGGAGGSIALKAGRLEGAGSIDTSAQGSLGYPGGGRVALLYGELDPDFDPKRQILARGGSSGGAGTIYLEALDAAGNAAGIGTLRVAGPADDGARGVTLLTGAGGDGLLRYAELDLEGAVSVLALEDLALGSADNPSAQLNDEAYIHSVGGARLQLRGQQGAIAAEPTFPPGDLLYERNLVVPIELSHPLGLEWIRSTWSYETAISTVDTAHAVLRQIAENTTTWLGMPPGPFSLKLEAHAVDGSRMERILEWNLLPNEPPTVSLSPESTEVLPRQQVQVTVSGQDREGLDSLKLEILGVDGYLPQIYDPVPKSTELEHVFTITVPADFSGTTLELQATAVDNFGATHSAVASLNVGFGSAPTGAFVFDEQEPLRLEPGNGFRLFIRGEDPDGDLKEATIVAVEGPAETCCGQQLPVSTSLFGQEQTGDFSLTVSPQAQAGETVVIHATVADHRGNTYELPPLTLIVEADSQPPYLEVSGPGEVTIGLPLTAQISAGDATLDRVEISFQGETSTIPADGETWLSYSFSGLATGPPGSTSPFVVKAYDRGGQMAESWREIRILADQPPFAYGYYSSDTYDEELGLSVAVAGSQVHFVVEAWDDVGLASAELRVSGLVSLQQTLSFDPFQSWVGVEFSVPANAQVGDTIELNATVTDSLGQELEIEPVVIYVTRLGLLPPSVEIYLDPEPVDGIYPAGSTLEVIAIGRRGDGSAEVSIDLEGRVETAMGVVEGEWQLPQVGTVATRTLRARAVSEEGLVQEITRQIQIAPASLPAELTLASPSEGALLPAGATLNFALEGRAAAGVERIELYRGGSLLGTLDPPGAPGTFGGSLAIVLPPQLGQVEYRAVLHPASGPAVQLTRRVTLADATLVEAGEEVEWSELEGSTVALGAGEWSFDERRQFANLILLPGARLSHAERSSLPEATRSRVELAVSGQVYVATGAAIDVSGRGKSAPENALGGANFGDGGLGLVGGNSLRRPRKPGGGSGDSRGGGVVAIEAESLVVDGEILADGQRSTAQAGGGAGGSVWIRATELGGHGRISAEGAGTADSAYGSGGGGVISLEYESLSHELRGNLSAKGGEGGNPGGAGALVFTEPGKPLGRLVVDGGGIPGAASSMLGFSFQGSGSGSGGALAKSSFGTLPHRTTLEGNIVTVSFREPQDLDPDDLIGAIVSIPWYSESEDERPYYRVVDARYLPGGCTEDDPYCLCGDGGECPPSCPEEEPYCNCAINGDCAPCPEEDPFCNCGLGGACPEALTGGLGLPSKSVLVPRSYLYDRYEIELRMLDGSDVGYIDDPRQLSTGGFFDHLLLRGHNSVWIGGLSNRRVEVDGESRSLHDTGSNGPDIDVDSLFLRRDARLYAIHPARSGAADIQADEELILARGAALDQTGAGGGEADLGSRPAGSGLSHIGRGGGLTNYNQYTHYDDFQNPTMVGAGFAGAAFGGGSMSATSDVLFMAPGSAVLANGEVTAAMGGSAGGAIQLHARLLAGDARIEAKGGVSIAQHGGGGGGILLSWQEKSGSWPDKTFACGGAGGSDKEAGGAGSVLLRGPQSVVGDLILDNCGLPGPFTYPFTFDSADNLALRGGAKILLPDELVGMERLVLGGPATIKVKRIEVGELTLQEGVVVTVPGVVTTDQPRETLKIRVEGDLVIETGARIDLTGQGFGGAYPGVASTVGDHIGYQAYTQAAFRGKTYGSIVQPQEKGTGDTFNASGGGAVEIDSANLYLVGGSSGILANGAASGNTSGGSVWIRTGALEGDGFIEARGGNSAAGGGGAIAIELDSATGTLLENVRAWGGANATTSGGAGSFFLFDRQESTYGVLRLDNNDRAGTTELPSLGSGAAATGTAGAELVTNLTAISSFFAGHRVEVRTSAGVLKGVWRIGSIAGNKLFLEPNGGETISLVPGDAWTGLYLFDRVERDLLVSFESVDPLRAPIVDFLGTGVPAGEAAMQTATSSLGPGETVSRPAADPSVIRFEAAEIEGLYRVTVPASILPSPQSFAWIRLGDLGRSVTAGWDPQRGASFLWAGEPGASLQLQAYDPRRPQETLSLELAPLPEPPASRGFGVNVQAEERILDLFSGERGAYLLLGRGDELELLEIDLEGRAIRTLGSLPMLHAEHRLALQDGELGIAARGGVDLLPDAFLVPGASGFEPLPLGLAAELFARPAGDHGQFRPTTEIQ